LKKSPDLLKVGGKNWAGASNLAFVLRLLASRGQTRNFMWQLVSELPRNPQLLIEQYQLRQGHGYGTPEQQEQQRLDFVFRFLPYY